jgi:NADPH-dependent 2,4-dienoyl-CoA reductase/sulfur reductase-like enzyme
VAQARYDYLIVGGGMTADAAVKGIRQIDANGSIAIVGTETDPPYKRPPLTKKLWQGMPIEKIWLGAEKHGVDLILGRTIETLDLGANTAVDNQGERYGYGKLLLATGVRPRVLPFGQHSIISYRTLDTYRGLRDLAQPKRRVAVIGAGFIGAELAASLNQNQIAVSMIFPGEGINDNLFPADLAHYLNDYYRAKGVELFPGEEAFALDQNGGRMRLRARNNARTNEREVDVDAVVSGIGTEPNTEVAEKAGIEVDNGIVVDEQLRANHPNVWAAGDVASFPGRALGRRRVEHEDNAKAMGRRAGRNMAGEAEPYTHLPMFYSDLFDLGYEAVGEVDSRHKTVADWKTPFREGVIYYLDEGRVRGVLLWNVWNQVDAARALIKEGGRVSEQSLKGKIPMSS